MKKIFSFYNNLSTPLKASFWFLFCNLVQKGISFISTPIFTRLMTKEEYGIYNTYLSWENIIIIFASLNLGAGVFNNALIKYKGKENEYTSSMQGLTTVLTLVVMGVILSFGNFFSNLMEVPIYVLILLTFELIFMPAMSFYMARERFEYRFKSVVLITIFLSISILFSGIGAVVLFDDKVSAKIISYIIVQSFFCGIIYINNFIKERKFFDKEYWIFALKFNLPLLPHYLSYIILSTSDRIIIKQMVGDAEAGIYSLAYNVGMILNIFINAITSVFTPYIYKELNDKRYKNIEKVSISILLFILIPLIGIVLVAPEIVLIMGGKDYLDAIYIIPPVVLGTFVYLIYSFFSTIEFYLEKTLFVMLGTVSAAIINIVLNLIFIPVFGYFAAGYTTLISYLFLVIIHYIFMRKIFKNRIYNIKKMSVISFLAFLAVFIILSIYSFSIIRYGILLGIVVLLIILRKKYMYLQEIFLF